MQALIGNKINVMEIVEKEYNVPSNLYYWVQIPANMVGIVKSGWFYVDNKFKKYNVPDDKYLYYLISDDLNHAREYHFYSEDVKTLSVNNTIKLNIKGDGRFLVFEQIHYLNLEIEAGEITPEEAKFIYTYNDDQHQVQRVPISLSNLKIIARKMMHIINFNYRVYQDHISQINALKSIDEALRYNYKHNYLINNNIDIIVNE